MSPMTEADCSLLKTRLGDRALHTDGGTAVESVLNPCGSSLNTPGTVTKLLGQYGSALEFERLK